LKEFLDLEISPEELASRLTMAGLEVTAREKQGKDICFEVEVTANRPDLLSVIGIAYEAGALTGRRPKPPKCKIKFKPTLDIPIEIEKKTDCSFYAARVIKGVKVGPSPDRLKNLLGACGINSVNNIVDITNYTMLKWGQPLHAFDLNKINGKIVVRRARPQEKLLCIDNKERILSNETLVIADERGVLALAGIMGGGPSGVTDRTTDILLEAAIFSPITTRRARRRLGINTDSSYRFERGVNPLYIEQASWEAAGLIIKSAGGRFAGYKKTGLKPSSGRPLIKFNNETMNHFLGTDIKESEALKILRGLDFEVRRTKNKTSIRPPAFRPDIKLQEDVFEEVARIRGYQNIQPKLPPVTREIKEQASFYKFKEKIREKVSRLGFKEVMTYSILSTQNPFISSGDDALASDEFSASSGIKIVNPLREGEDILRPSVFLGMVEVFVYNVYRKQRNLEFFEIADSFLRKKDSFKESPKLCMGRHADDLDDFYPFKGKVEAFLRECGIENITLKEKEHGLFSNLCLIEDFGWLGILEPVICEKLDLKHVFLAEFDLEELSGKVRPPVFKDINYLPWIERDISLAVRKDIKFKDVEKIIKGRTGQLLKDFEVVDVYKGEKIAGDSVGFTLRVSYQHKERTLEAREVDSLHFKLREALAQKDGIVLR